MARKPTPKKKPAAPKRAQPPGQITPWDLTELLAHTWEPVLMFDFGSGALMYWNRAAEDTYAYTADEALGRNVHELLRTAPDVQEIRSELERAERWSGELSHRRKDGARIDVEARLVLVRQPGGTTVAIESTRPISERKAMEEELRAQAAQLVAADKNRNGFLALLAHELRTPLGALRNIAQLLRTPSATPESLDRTRVIMNRQIQNMARMIDDLLDVARISQGQIELRRETVDLAAVIDRAIEATRARIVERGQRLSLSLSDEPLNLDGDVTRLEQVFVNLLSNASTFSHPGGQIWLTTEVLHSERRAPASSFGGRFSQVIVRLRDDGIGIGEAMLPRVFDLFVQAERSPERMEGGLGLGLNVVKRVIELHGGAVEAISAGIGMGSEFIVRLPLAPVLIGAAPGPDDTSAVGREPGVSRRVLVVDDDPDTAETLGLLLREEGHDVRVESDAEAALAVVGEFRPEIAILDIALPGMDGYELAAALLARPELRKLRLVALTGFDQKAIDPGGTKGKVFDHMLQKPVDPDILKDILQGR